nr:TIGR03032 family protein [Marinicella sp. NBU2979]
MQATQWLAQLPYLSAVMASFNAPIGRTRLMRIEGDAAVPKHTDLDYYWIHRLRIHVPIITNDLVCFECGGASVNMAAGEAWVFDTTEQHRVTNPQGGVRIHLVMDTVGSDHIHQLMSQDVHTTQCTTTLEDLKAGSKRMVFEQHNRPPVMSPAEQQAIHHQFLEIMATEHDPTAVKTVAGVLQPIMRDWAAVWAEHAAHSSGQPAYIQLQKRLQQAVKSLAHYQLRGSGVDEWIRHWLIDPALGDADLNPTSSDADGQNKAQDNTNQAGFSSQYTESFPALLAHLNGSLAVTTYASNRVVLLRANGTDMNTHFKDFHGPMGLACDGQQLALGVQNAIWLFRSQPDLQAVVGAPCDVVYRPTKQHITGDVRVHELAWSGHDLWWVNTRFSCLSTLDDEHSFVPQWHPKFINNLSAEDACHLNGLAMRDGRPSWVTALGVSDQPSGWRDNKLNGGVVLDVASQETVTHGLCMPHSPRWHGNALWVLDSGLGRLCQVDLSTGARETVTEIPGFARGLAMVDRYAFIGGSRVREAAWFSGLPILAQEQKPECGIWAVDLVSGQLIGWLKFADGIDEIFDVQWLPNVLWPEILEPDEDTTRNGFTLPAEQLNQFTGAS